MPSPLKSPSNLSPQVHHLRQKVDEIDRKILSLLQQRTGLSRRIGQAKRRQGTPIYAPEREGELFARLARKNRGPLPPAALAAIYREIISSSRYIQGQPPVGVLKSSAAAAILPVRWHLGACEQIAVQPDWTTLADRLEKGALVLGLLTRQEWAKVRKELGKKGISRFEVVGKWDKTASGQEFLVIRPRSTPS